MDDDSKVLDIIVEELTEAKEKHAVPRRTMIKPDEGEYPSKKRNDLSCRQQHPVVVDRVPGILAADFCAAAKTNRCRWPWQPRELDGLSCVWGARVRLRN